MDNVERVARGLLQTRVTGRPCDPGPRALTSRAEALAVQRRVAQTLAEPGGFKVGRQGEGPPALAPIPSDRIFESGEVIGAPDPVGVELEVGFTLIAPPGRDPLARAADIFRPRVVLELCGTRLAGPTAEDPWLKLADMQANWGMVVGPLAARWDGSDMATLAARLCFDGAPVIDGPARCPAGTPLASLRTLCRWLGDHCGGLREGHTVITGSLSGLRQVSRGTSVAGSIDGLGVVACRIA